MRFSIGAVNVRTGNFVYFDNATHVIGLVYRSKRYEGNSKDYEFSRPSMEEHWRAGYQDTTRTLRHPEVLQRPTSADGVLTFDLAYDGRE